MERKYLDYQGLQDLVNHIKNYDDLVFVSILPAAPDIEDKIYGINASVTSTVETTANITELGKVNGLEYNLLTTTFTPKDGFLFTQATSIITSIVYDDSGTDPIYTINYEGGYSTSMAEDTSIIFNVTEIITDYYIGNAETQLLTPIEQGVLYKFLTAADIDTLMSSVAGQQWDYLADVIVDTATSTKKVWSSSKITTELSTTLDASKTYTDEQIARFRNTSYVLVSSTAEMTDPSVLYLLPIVGEDDTYEIYALIKDASDVYVPTAIGTTQTKLEDYYTKLEADALFVKGTDVITKTKYGNEVGDVTQLDPSFSSSDIVGCLNELSVFETVNIIWP